MGVERAITRWYVQRQLLLDEIMRLETKIAPSSTDDGATSSQAETQQKIAQVQEKLRMLGACPRPMMG